MRELVAKLKTIQPLKYIFIGGVSYVVEMAMLLTLAHLLHQSPTHSVAISFWSGFVLSFTLQKYIVFDNKAIDRKTLGRQTVLYGLLVLFNYLFTIIFVGIFTDLVGLAIARTIALMFTVSWNYPIYKRIYK